MKKILSFVFGASVSSILFRLFILTVISWLIWTPNLKFMWISGESMTPTYEDGDVVFSQTQNCSDCDGKMLITKIFGETMD